MVNVSDLVGLGKRDAQNKSELKNLIWRLVSVNGERFLGWPEDKREDRVCVEIVNEKVVSAVIQ
jgi:hypothetical protein